MTDEGAIQIIRNMVFSNPVSQWVYELAKAGKFKDIDNGFEKMRPQFGNEKMACTKGCSFCCMLNVDINGFEEPRLKKALDGLDSSKIEKVLHSAKMKNQITEGLPEGERQKKRIMCALNIDGLCAIYEDRPLSCRAFHIKYLDICIEGNKEESDVQSIEWRQPKEAKMFIELGYGLYLMDHEGKNYDELAETLESFIVRTI